eukprot:jgi/Ulvmu1/10854/UM007_0028.1
MSVGCRSVLALSTSPGNCGRAWAWKAWQWLAMIAVAPVTLTTASATAPMTQLTPTLWRRAHVSGDLPLLDDSEHGPNSTLWSNSVAICATMKEENSTDVREWLLYYRWLGVEHVYLTENAEEPTPHLRAEVDDFVQSGFLTYRTEARPRTQMKVYYECMHNNHAKYNWLAFFDLDEFLILRPGEEQRLPDFLDAYKQYPGLSVHWVLVGPSGRHTRPPAGGVLQHYLQCAGTGNYVIKTIANTFFLANIATHPHNFEFRDRQPSVDEQLRPVPEKNNRVCLPHGVVPWDDRPNCYLDAGAAHHIASVTKAALFHYATRSRQDYAAKLARGSAMSRRRRKSWATFNALAEETQETGGLCNLPARAAADCCPLEALVLHA